MKVGKKTNLIWRKIQINLRLVIRFVRVSFFSWHFLLGKKGLLYFTRTYVNERSEAHMYAFPHARTHTHNRTHICRHFHTHRKKKEGSCLCTRPVHAPPDSWRHSMATSSQSWASSAGFCHQTTSQLSLMPSASLAIIALFTALELDLLWAQDHYARWPLNPASSLFVCCCFFSHRVQSFLSRYFFFSESNEGSLRCKSLAGGTLDTWR